MTITEAFPADDGPAKAREPSGPVSGMDLTVAKADIGKPSEESAAAAKSAVEEKIAKPADKSEQRGADPFFAKLSVRTQKLLEADSITTRRQLADMSRQTMLEAVGAKATDEIKAALQAESQSSEPEPAPSEKKSTEPAQDGPDPLANYIAALDSCDTAKECDKLLSNAKISRSVAKDKLGRLEILVADRKAAIEAKAKK